MRYIVIFLIVANLFYFAWNQTHPVAPVLQTRESRPLLNNGLMLVSEFAEQSAQQALLDDETSRLCSIVRGFTSVDEANAFMAAAREAVFGVLLNLTGQALNSQYRVYLPPASSRSIATITLDGLSERIIAAELAVETYLITRGLLENGIALGIFGAATEAEAVRRAIAELGYEPEIEEIPQSDGEIQVWLRPTNSGQVENPEWLDLSTAWPDLTRTENLCETIAQATQFP